MTQQTNNGNSLVVTFAVNQSNYTPNVTAGQSITVYANDLDNAITLVAGGNTIETFGGNDTVNITPGSTGIIDGSEGIDRAVFTSTRASVGPISKVGNILKVGDVYSFLGVEYLEFSDVLLDTSALQEVRVASFLTNTGSIAEGVDDNARTVRFQVNLDKPATTDTVIAIAVIGGSATANSDFVPPPAILTVASGQSSATFDLVATNDNDPESHETVVIEASLPVGVQFEDGSQKALLGVTIRDDDEFLALATFGIQAILEGPAGTVNHRKVQITRTGNISASKTLNYNVVGSGGSPAVATDFAGGAYPSGTVTFAAGESFAEISLSIAGNDKLESDREFTLSFTATDVVPDPLVYTIIDDDQPSTSGRLDYSLTFGFSGTNSQAQVLQIQRLDNDGNLLENPIPLAGVVGATAGLPTGFQTFSRLTALGDLLKEPVIFSLANPTTILPQTLQRVDDGAGKFRLVGNNVEIHASPLAQENQLTDVSSSIKVGGETMNGIDFDSLNGVQITGTRSFELSAKLFREAAYDNTVAFYLASKTNGDVLDPLTDNTIMGGQLGIAAKTIYGQVAFTHAVWRGSVANSSSSTLSSVFDVGDAVDLSQVILLPVIQVNSSSLTKFYVSGTQTNSDRSTHVLSLGSNSFGFEDLAFGGDGDFDDMIVQVDKWTARV